MAKAAPALSFELAIQSASSRASGPGVVAPKSARRRARDACSAAFSKMGRRAEGFRRRQGQGQQRQAAQQPAAQLVPDHGTVHRGRLPAA